MTGPRTHPIRLSGTWRFAPTLPDGFERPDFDDSDWSDITVPGEWVMQGFTVEPGKPAGFRTSFKAPKSWRRRAVKIRFDAVYSICDVYLNGQHVGSHEGGFTPFEVDITSTVIPGKPNTLALAVTSESTADTMASASTYARHPLGGIARKVTAFAVPKVHLTRFHADTDLDADYEDATLTILAEVAGPTDGVELRVDLRHPTGMMEEIGQCSVPTDGTVTMVADVRAPELWDSEHPNLYTLWGLLKVNGKVKEFVTRRIGFREVEVRGNQLFVNGDVVKLRGVCRHEVHPDLGRSMTHKIWTRDIELLKGANVNYVRTAHYPPAEEFISRCDKAGIYVQDEGPWCWASASAANSPETLGLVMRSNAEMIERDRSHPSVIIWDIANESNWGSNYARANDYIHAEDPSRPTLFSYQPDPSPTDIITWHYPGIDGPARAADSDKPITFDEYCHLNCYNPAEVEADPGLRDYWGHALEDMWNAMYESQGVLGGAIWCWCDDVFDLPTGRAGYGEWGPVDGFRRPKPEWWHVRKVYSPIHIRVDRLEPGQVFIPIQNRYNHTNLSEIECRWRLGEGSGTLHLDVPPGGTGVLPFLIKSPEHDALHLTFIDPSDRLVDEYAIPVGPRTTPALDALSREAPDVDGISIILTEQESGREVTLEGDITSTATEITYTATYSGDPITVREVGLKLTLAGGLQNLSWRRIGQWSVYPDDHIGRLTGETAAFPVAEGDPRPESWSQDHDPRGCNDFRSTKYSITRASLTDDSGAGVGVVSDGRHSIRASVEGDAVVLRICEFSNGGGERFLRGHYAADYRTIDPGDVIAGAVLLHLVQPR
ncbi:MAG TPA: glycoside hydrolase family 2 TIM barrel-domain containing protein [Armatimonadota bacterium]|nr:glycoside hydrolase family 2 TIM barrel-domain containing protein [Armatimonadota bacterium]